MPEADKRNGHFCNDEQFINRCAKISVGPAFGQNDALS